MLRATRAMVLSTRTAALVLVLLCAGQSSLVGRTALAQAAPDAPGQAPAASSAPRVLTDPETGERYVEVHPSEALERGRWAVDPWLVWGVGAFGALAGAAVLGRRALRARRGR